MNEIVDLNIQNKNLSEKHTHRYSHLHAVCCKT